MSTRDMKCSSLFRDTTNLNGKPGLKQGKTSRSFYFLFPVTSQTEKAAKTKTYHQTNRTSTRP